METRWFQYICSAKSSSGFLFSPSFPYADYIMKLPSITFIDTNRHSLLHIWHLLSLLFTLLPETNGTVTIAQFHISQYDNSIYFSKYFYIQKESPTMNLAICEDNPQHYEIIWFPWKKKRKYYEKDRFIKTIYKQRLWSNWEKMFVLDDDDVWAIPGGRKRFPGIVCFFRLQNIVIYDYNVKDNTG